MADSATIVIARDDDYFFGVLHSKFMSYGHYAKAQRLKAPSLHAYDHF